MSKITNFIKKNAVLLIAAIVAIVTSCIITPDREYINYFDFKTLTCLFCTLAVICCLRNIKFFTYTAQLIVEKATIRDRD